MGTGQQRYRPYGSVVFYDSQGDLITSGTDMSNPFAWAVGVTSEDANVTAAQLTYAVPQQGTAPALWSSQPVNHSSLPATSAPPDVNTLSAAYPTVAGGSAASLTSFNTSYPTTGVAGYQDVVQVRVTDSGPNGAGSTTGKYWESDVAFNPTTSPITVLGVTVPANGWAQVFPVVDASTISLSTSAPGGSLGSNSSITLTADVTPAGAAGSVNFFDNGTLLGSATVTNGTATYTYTPGGGTQVYTASFVPTLGDISNPGSASATMVSGSTSSQVSVTVNDPATTTTVTSSSNPSVVGEAVTYTATVTSGGGTPNAGTVDFQDGGSTMSGCGAEAVSSGTATCRATPGTAGNHTITAVYSPGPAPFDGSTSVGFTQTVNQGTTSTALTATPSPGGIGQPVTLTATIAVTSGAGTPSGTVLFDDNASPITSPSDCSAVPLGTDGKATCTTTFTSGTQNLSAIYQGDSNFSGSNATASEAIYPPTTTAVTSSSTGNTSVVGETVTYTAAVSSSSTVSGGTVSFTDNGGAIPACSGASSPTVGNGQATCDVTYSGVGSHLIAATYNPGSAPFAGSSTSSPLAQTVDQATTQTTFTSIPDPSVTGQSVSLSANVSVLPPGTGPPTGSVLFQVGGTTLCAGTLTSGGTASCSVSSLDAVGSPYAVIAAYQGDTNYSGSNSGSSPQTVNPAGTSMTLTSSANPSYTGQAVVYTARLTVTGGGSGTPTGSVIFKNGTTTVCTSALSAGSATAACTETISTAGAYSITASYAGDSNYGGATPANLSQTVLNQVVPPTPTPVAVAPAHLTAAAGDGQVTLTWSAPASGGGSPITGYDIYVGTSPGRESTSAINASPVTGTSYTVDGLTDGTTYYFVVETVSATGNSAASNEVSARPLFRSVRHGEVTGYWLIGRDGGVFSFGTSQFHGSLGGVRLVAPIVASVTTADGGGYWLVASDGGVFSFGDAHFYGSLGGVHLVQPIVAMVATADGQGYWLVAADGGVFSFGDAGFYGSLGGVHLDRPIVAAAASPDGRGYTMVASDGGVFSFGDATYAGSLAGVHLSQPVVSMIPTASGPGYWLIGADGGIFAFGDATYWGSVPALHASIENVISGA